MTDTTDTADTTFPILTAEHIARIPSAMFDLASLLSTGSIGFNAHRAAWLVLLFDAVASGLLHLCTWQPDEDLLAYWRATLYVEGRQLVAVLSP